MAAEGDAGEAVERLTCGNGAPWTARGCGPCVKCQREADEMNRQFWRAVFFGDYLPSGHTPQEWAARAQKGSEA